MPSVIPTLPEREEQRDGEGRWRPRGKRPCDILTDVRLCTPPISQQPPNPTPSLHHCCRHNKTRAPLRMKGLVAKLLSVGCFHLFSDHPKRARGRRKGWEDEGQGSEVKPLPVYRDLGGFSLPKDKTIKHRARGYTPSFLHLSVLIFPTNRWPSNPFMSSEKDTTS